MTRDQKGGDLSLRALPRGVRAYLPEVLPSREFKALQTDGSSAPGSLKPQVNTFVGTDHTHTEQAFAGLKSPLEAKK